MTETKLAATWEQHCLNKVATLPEVNLQTQALAMGLSMTTAGEVAAKLFGRDYLINSQEVLTTDRGKPSSLHQGILVHYLSSQGRGELTGEYIPIGRLTGISVTSNSPSGHLSAPLVAHFGDKYGVFTEVAAKLGGRHEGRSLSGGESWVFSDLPFLPIQIVFFEADEEFEAEVKVLFDASATVFIPYEALEILEMLLVGEFLSAAGFLGCGSDCSGSCDSNCDENCGGNC